MLVIKNGKIVTMTGRLIDGGDILIENSVIRDLTDESSYVPTLSDTVIDAKGFFVFPGFIDMHTHCGLDGTASGDAYRNELLITPYMKTSMFINPDSTDFTDRLSSGITSTLVAPFDSRIVGGKCCMVKTYSHDGKLNIVSDDCGIQFSLAGMSDENYSVYPDSIPAFIKDDLRCAREYLSPNNKSDNVLDSPSFSAYGSILSCDKPAFFNVTDEHQFNIAEKIAKSFSLNAVMVLDMKDTAGLLGLYDMPFIIDPSKVGNLTLKNLAGEISSNNAEFAISASSHDFLPVNTGLFVRAGLDMEKGFEAITTNPAAICGLSNKIGSLQSGLDADIVLWNDNPLEIMAKVVCSVVGGHIAYSELS